MTTTGTTAKPNPVKGKPGKRTGKTRARRANTAPRSRGGADPNAGFQESQRDRNVLRAMAGRKSVSAKEKERRQQLAEDKSKKIGRDKVVNRSEAARKYFKKYATTVTFSCAPTISVYMSSKNRQIQRSRKVGETICGMKKAYKFPAYRGGGPKYKIQENEYRVFVEGAEVTSYIEGALSWTIESTGGMNSCRFTLNNSQDAFIITPKNVCAGPYNPTSWRVPVGQAKKGGAYYVYTASNRSSWRVDEVAKFIIYKNKFESVHPKRAGEDFKQIDPYTGMWLYPLNPFSCIFNKHDAVRVFVRLPHVPSSGRSNYQEGFDLWMPAFTGFIKDYSWNDAPIEGKRTVNITCYDYRGLLDRMRVRVYAAGNKPSPEAQTEKGKQKQKSTNSKKKPDAKSTDSIAKSRWDDQAIKVGKQYSALLSNNKNFKSYASLLKEAKPDSWEFAQAGFHAFDTVDDAHVLYMTFLGTGGSNKVAGCAPKQTNRPNANATDKPNYARGQFSQKNKEFDYKCQARAVQVADGVFRPIGARLASLTGKIMQNSALIFDLVGTPYQFFVDVKKSTYNNKTRALSVKLQVIQGSDRRQRGKGLKEWQKRSAVGRINEAVQFMEKNKVKFRTAAKDYIQNYIQSQAPQKNPTSFTRSLVSAYKIKADKAFNTMKSIEDQVVAILNKGNNPIFNPENKPKEVSVIEGDQLQKAVINQKKIIHLLKQERDRLNPNDQADFTEWNLLSLKIQAAQKQLQDMQQQVGAKTLTGDFSYRDWLGLSEYGIVNRFKLLAVAGVGINYPTGGIQNAVFRKTALDNFKNYIDKGKIQADKAAVGLLEAWKKRYVSAAAKAVRMAKEKNDEANALLNGKGKDSSGLPLKLVPLLQHIAKLRDLYYKKLPDAYQGPKGMENLKGVRARTRQLAAKGGPATVGEALTKYANFEVKHAGIFADLVTRLENAQSHPLKGKSFHEAIDYLCQEQQKIRRGIIGPSRQKGEKVGLYNYQTDRKMLAEWNDMVVFGVVQRPLSYNEVTYIGRKTVSDLGEDFSPYNAFYHLLLPGGGTSGNTITQKHTGKTGINSMTISYETRKKLLDDICGVIDYQYWVSGMGDLIFEFPHYNVMPDDFGFVYQGAYKLFTDWKDSTIAEEAQDIPTAWVIEGMDADKTPAKSLDGKKAAKEALKRVVITAPILARRLGVRVENVNLRIPGIGAPTDSGISFDQALDQLRVYGLFHIQRQLGRAHTMQVSMPFRPYIVPNRPVYLVHRQRIGLTQSVTHSMSGPNGDATTDVNLGYTRWTFRDGTWRHMAGGARLPIDYVSFFTGIPPKRIPASSGNGNDGASGPIREGVGTARGATSVSCSGTLKTRLLEASAFSSDVAAQWGAAFAPQLSGGLPSAQAGSDLNLRNTGFAVSSSTDGTVSSSTNTDRFKGDPLKYVYQDQAWLTLTQGRATPGSRLRGYESFGYLRRAGAGGRGQVGAYRLSSGNWDYIHAGWDIPAHVGQIAKAPVDIYKAEAVFKVGPWQGGGFTYGWARGTKAEYKEFAVASTPQDFLPAVGPITKIYATQYLLWKALGGKKSGIKVKYGTTGGLILNAYGNVKLPGLNTDATMKACLTYVHLHALMEKDGKFIGGELKENSNPNEPLVRAGQPIAYCGKTATANSHLHLELYIQPGAARTPAAKQQVRVALAANKAFIDATLRARAGFYNASQLQNATTADGVNKNAASYWQSKYFARKFGRPPGQVRVQDVVKYFQKRKQYQQFVPSDPERARWVLVNPAHYFKPSDVLGVITKRYKKPLLRYGPWKDKVVKVEKYGKGAEIKAKKKWCGEVSSFLAEKGLRIGQKCRENVQKRAANWSKRERDKAFQRCINRQNFYIKFSAQIEIKVKAGRVNQAIRQIERQRAYIDNYKYWDKKYDSTIPKADDRAVQQAIVDGKYPDLR